MSLLVFLDTSYIFLKIKTPLTRLTPSINPKVEGFTKPPIRKPWKLHKTASKQLCNLPKECFTILPLGSHSRSFTKSSNRALLSFLIQARKYATTWYLFPVIHYIQLGFIDGILYKSCNIPYMLLPPFFPGT